MVMLAYIGKLNIQAHCADYFSVYPHGKKKKKTFFSCISTQKQI